MNAAPHDGGRGADRLLEHCAAFGRLVEPRPSAAERLEAVLGGDLARLLRDALAGEHGMRPRLFAF